jgi:penicillin-binding protein 1A
MNAFNRKAAGGPRRRVGKNDFVTKSGKVVKRKASLTQRWVNGRDAKQQRKALRQATLPKDRVKRFFAHFEPKRMYHYWFSREGGIMALKILGISIAAGFLLLIGVFAYFRKDLPNLKDISGGNIGGSISYYDKTGQTLLWEDYDAVKRIPVKNEAIADYLKMATVATEDKDFYKHGGFDVRGIMRAGVNDVFGNGGTQGGSTITQQLVKLTQNWTEQRTLTRKVKELILAVELERSYSKQDILVGYLNAAPYGNIEYGAQAAANDYFHKDAKDLTLAESAFLAAIPKSPSYYSPYGAVYKQDPTTSSKAVVDRQHYILDLMVQQGMIKKEDAEAAKKVNVLATIQPQASKYAGIKAPYFVTAAKREVEERCSTTVKCGGWKVVTTLDMDLQNKAEQLVADNLNKIRRYGADNEAVVTEDVQTGQIVALVGGVDFTNPDFGQNNFASGILIPPGSSFKPYDYAAFIENNTNVGAGSVLYDTEGPLPGYPCTNKQLPKNGGNCLKDYDFLTPGPITLRYALGGSRNIPAVKAMLSTIPNDTSDGKVNSINKTISTASDMMDNPSISGNTYNCYSDEALTKTTQCYGASAIGDGAFLHLDDHVNGLSTLARGGKAIPRTYLIKITDAANKTVYQFQQPKGKQAIREDTAYIVNDMASDPRASYLPGSCTETDCTSLNRGGYKFHRYKGWKFAIKTGTTNDGYDGLMTSWSGKYATVSWVGNHTRHVTLSTTMEVLTEPLTRGMMEAAHANLNKVENWNKPSGVQSLPAFVVRNHIHYGDIEPSPTNDLFPSWYKAKSNANSSQTIDKVSNKVATSCTPEAAKQNFGNSNANNWNVDIFVGGSASSGGSTAGGNDDVHNCGDSKPTVTVTPAGSCTVGTACSFTVTASSGTYPLSDPARSQFQGSLTLTANGQNVGSAAIPFEAGNVYSTTMSYTPTSAGDINVSVSILDSVLYGASDDTTLSVGGGSSALTITGANPGTDLVTWSGGTGTVTIRRKSGSQSCSANDGSCKLVGLTTGWTIYAEDNNGHKSADYSL